MSVAAATIGNFGVVLEMIGTFTQLLPWVNSSSSTFSMVVDKYKWVLVSNTFALEPEKSLPNRSGC